MQSVQLKNKQKIKLAIFFTIIINILPVISGR